MYSKRTHELTQGAAAADRSHWVSDYYDDFSDDGDTPSRQAISNGFYPVVNHGLDTFAIPGVGGKPS